MRAHSEITFDDFCLATQLIPENDDLERCNCTKAGQEGHESCGWNYQLNLPQFMGNGPYFPFIDGEYRENYYAGI